MSIADRFRRLSDQEIIRALSPWELGCAVGAMNGSIYGHIGSCGYLDFETWLRRLDKRQWRMIRASRRRIRKALRTYAQTNSSLDMKEVIRREEQDRGKPPSVVLMPGESVSLNIRVEKTSEEQ